MNIRDDIAIALTRRQVEMIWSFLPKFITRPGRQRYENPLFRELGAIADPWHADPVANLHQRNLEREAAILRAFDAGHPRNAIAAEYGITTERVRQILKRNGRPKPKPNTQPITPDWLTPQWREEFAQILDDHGVLVR